MLSFRYFSGLPQYISFFQIKTCYAAPNLLSTKNLCVHSIFYSRINSSTVTNSYPLCVSVSTISSAASTDD